MELLAGYEGPSFAARARDAPPRVRLCCETVNFALVSVYCNARTEAVDVLRAVSLPAGAVVMVVVVFYGCETGRSGYERVSSGSAPALFVLELDYHETRRQIQEANANGNMPPAAPKSAQNKCDTKSRNYIAFATECCFKSNSEEARSELCLEIGVSLTL